MRVETQISAPVVSQPRVAAREVRTGGGFYASIGKRIFDLTVSITGFILFSPLFLVLAALVKISSRGPVLFKQQRVGRAGNLFFLYKFRSMRADAAANGPSITSAGDSRITAFGRFVRKTKLDELPQLWNVLRREMSLVGPRPEVPEYVRDCAAYTLLLNVRPGITDPASVAFRHEESILATKINPENFYREQLLPQKLALSSEYIENISFRGDLSILFLTFLSVFQTSPRQGGDIGV
jgi:lipopolysaccharide/colanic/teichoic acid biosynthesis glycosyltransferase